MSTNPLNLRYPFELKGQPPEVVQAHRYSFQGILDVNQAIAAIKSQVDAVKSSVAANTATINSMTATETVIEETGAEVGAVNNQTGVTSYKTQESDYGKIIIFDDASAIAVTLNVTASIPGITMPWYTQLTNLGAGTITVTPASGQINNNATISLAQNNSAFIFFDGTNFWAIIITNGAGAFLPINNPTFTGVMTGPLYASDGTIPSVVVGAAAGTGATATMVTKSNSSGGQIDITTGTSLSTGTLATITFPTAYPNGCFVIVTTPGSGTYVACYANGTAGGFTLLTATVLSASTPYVFTYIVSGF